MFFFQAEDGIRYLVRSRGLGDVYKRQGDEGMDKIRILIVDDHFVVRLGLRTLLETEPDMTVVGEGANGVEGVAQAALLLSLIHI